MTSPQRIFTVYQRLLENAEEIRDFQVAQGDKVSGTINMLLKADRAKLLSRWGEEMDELCGVIEGTHDDPYIVEATQCFYWASLYAVTGGTTWDDIDFENIRLDQVDALAVETPSGLYQLVLRILEKGEGIPAQKLFLLWHAADRLYRQVTPPEKQWTVEQLMDYDLADMKKRTYLQPILAMTEAL